MTNFPPLPTVRTPPSKPTKVDRYLQETFYPDITDPVILEIRRERAIELVYEGFRADDLKRWKEGKNFERVPWTGIHVPNLNAQFDVNYDYCTRTAR